MADQYPKLDDRLTDFLERQKIFFAATAAEGTRVNVSPRPMDCFRVISETEVGWIDMTGSGMETAAHLRADGRLTIMVCAFEGPPRILRLYGRGTSHLKGSAGYAARLPLFDAEPPGARQIVTLDIDLVQTSCGYGVPFFSFEGWRDGLHRWTEKKGDGLRDFQRDNNLESLDGLPTGVTVPEP